MNKLINLLSILACLCSACGLDKSQTHTHRFTMTCKVDCIREQFITEEGRQKALRFFKDHHVELVYLESYRHGVSVSSEILEEVKHAFEKAGIQCAGCITTTQMSDTKSTEWDIATCFTDSTGRDFLKKTVMRTAKLFDLIILDDFYFMACQCDLCKDAKGDRSWKEFRLEHMMEVSKEDVVAAAKAVNPNCKIIIKYPCWYENLQESGYDVINETALFDYSFAGTETRDGGPQTQACWYQSWLNEISNGKCAGGWYDPLSTSPETYVEQARQTILGGAKESLLHCYDYLGTDKPGIAIDPDAGVKNGKADAQALLREINGLQQLADYIAPMKPKGVLLAKKPNEQPEADMNLIGKIGLLGIPFIASGNLKENDAYFLTAHASRFDNLNQVVKRCLENNAPLALSKQVYSDLDTILQKQLNGKGELLPDEFLLLSVDGSVIKVDNPFKMNKNQLNDFRNHLLRPFNLQMDAPRNVSLHLFTSEKEDMEVIENFNDEPVTITITFPAKRKKKLKLGLPSNDKVRLIKNKDMEYSIYLEPRTLALIGGL